MAKNASENVTEDTSVEVVARGPEFSDSELLDIDSFDAAYELAQFVNDGVEDVGKVLGNGFAILDDKDALVGVPCLLLSWNFNRSKVREDQEFVSILIVARPEGGTGIRKVIVNDGGTGIYQQLKEYSNRKGKMGGLLARRGLRKSEYENEFTSHGVTYYIDVSA